MIQSIAFRAMNTDVLLAAEGERAVVGIQAARDFIEECEQRFSRFLPTSEVSELNRSAGEWQDVSNELMDMLGLSLRHHFETKGLFDPTILTGLKQMGYDRSMEDIRVNGVTSLPHASTRTSKPGFHEIKFDSWNGRVLLPRGMEVDLGGIAKGWIVEKAAQLLNTYAESCAVSAGGDMLFIGRPSDGMDWDVLLEDPRDPSWMLSQLHVGPGAVATSSVRKRSWLQGENIRHHLIDPRTGESARTDWLSVTVIAPQVVTADVYSKALLIGGERESADLLHIRPEITFIAVDPYGNLLGSPGFKDYLYETADTNVSIRIA